MKSYYEKVKPTFEKAECWHCLEEKPLWTMEIHPGYGYPVLLRYFCKDCMELPCASDAPGTYEHRAYPPFQGWTRSKRNKR